VPVDVSVSLLASQAQDVEAFGGDGSPDRLTDTVHDRLQSEVLGGAEVPGYLFAVLSRCDQHIAVERRVLVQERNCVFVLVDQYMRKLGIACDELADKATPFEVTPYPFEVHTPPSHVISLSFMERRRLSGTDLQITPVGVGTAPIGSGRDWPAWWGPQDQRESVRTIHTALELGINWIDTAPFYGWGRAEEIVGRALRERADDDVLVFTKCGTLPDEERGDRMDLRPETIRADLEASLRRLRRERVDLLQLHDVDRNTPIEESWGEVQRLIEEGKVRYGGISNHRAADVERALAVGPVGALQYQYSLLHRTAEAELLPLAAERGIGVLTWSPLAAGFLADGFEPDRLDPDDFRRTHPFAELDLSPLRVCLGRIGERKGRTAAQVALAWVLKGQAVTGAIVGVRTAQEAHELPGAADLELDAAQLEEIEASIP